MSSFSLIFRLLRAAPMFTIFLPGLIVWIPCDTWSVIIKQLWSGPVRNDIDLHDRETILKQQISPKETRPGKRKSYVMPPSICTIIFSESLKCHWVMYVDLVSQPGMSIRLPTSSCGCCCCFLMEILWGRGKEQKTEELPSVWNISVKSSDLNFH